MCVKIKYCRLPFFDLANIGISDYSSRVTWKDPVLTTVLTPGGILRVFCAKAAGPECSPHLASRRNH